MSRAFLTARLSKSVRLKLHRELLLGGAGYRKHVLAQRACILDTQVLETARKLYQSEIPNMRVRE